MWSKKINNKQESKFFDGENICHQLLNSIFGKIKQTFNEIFTEDDTKNYSLPKIIVIGNESTGKSSLLENITKCQLFPRDSKLCTKCPVCIKLTNGPISKYNVTYQENKKFIKINLFSKFEIYDIVLNYMKTLPDDFISEQEILIDITDPDIPTFEFYDLPGIRTYPPETAEITLKLCKKYLSDKNSIVLCVVPATTTRLTSCQSIALISEMKMEHNCILALTMVDRLQPENIEELLIKRIIKTSDELINLNFAGYVAIINRIHLDKISLIENDTIEKKWFDDNIIECIPEEYNNYENLIRENVSISNLVQKIDQLYNKFINEDWKPRILESINDKLSGLVNSYSLLGEEIIDNIKINNYIHKFLKSLIKQNLFESEIEYENDNKSIDIYSIDNYKKFNKISSEIETTCDKNMDIFIANISLKISNYFNNEDIYKLKRFEKVNQLLFDKIITYINDNENKLISIKNNIKIYQTMQLLKCNVCDFNKINGRINLLLKYNIIYPLLNINIDFKQNDYVESDKYKKIRNDLKNQINTVKINYDKIYSL